MIADIQILRDHVKHVGLSYIFRCLSVTSFLLWGAPCHEWTLGFPKWNISAFSTRKGSCKVSKKMEDRLCRETKLVPGQNHTGRELLGCSEIICSAPQPQGRLSSALVLPSGCCPAVKSYRETGSFLPSGLSCPQSQILFLFLLSDLSVSSALQIHGLSALVATERRLVHVYKSVSLWLKYVELQWGSSSTSSDLRECRAQLCPLLSLKRVWGQHQPVTCPLVASAAEAEPTSRFDRWVIILCQEFAFFSYKSCKYSE